MDFNLFRPITNLGESPYTKMPRFATWGCKITVSRIGVKRFGEVSALV
jgi:hypothetical protein